jgi:D-beta-D-heptose 7-phosphate kinase/D-beta-D-heptose 1-phosphate adenosyltransferase
MTPSVPPAATLAGAIEKLVHASVLVVGDVMLDRYVFGTASRLSPEAPVPVLAVTRELALPGGAGNVVRNLTALGAAAALVSVVGDDQAGSDLTGLIGVQPNVEPWLLVQGSRCTTVKTRFVADGQQLLRTDQETTKPIHTKLADRMLRIAGDALAATSVTVLSDYAKGVLAGATAGKIIEAARAAGRQVVVDPRGIDLDRFAGADVVVLTQRALEAATGMAVTTQPQIEAAARWLRLAHGFAAIVINRRADGLLLIAATESHAVAPPAGEMFDFTGAGDTAVAAVAATLATGQDLLTAVRIAALAIAVAAGQPGMALAPAADLIAMLTPDGRARRRIVSPAAAADQISVWRLAGLRTSLITAAAETLPLVGLETLRHNCDRLVLAVEDATADSPALAQAAAAFDLVCPYPAGARAETLELLRADLVLDGAD